MPSLSRSPVQRSSLPQSARLLAAIIYVVALLLLARYLNGTFLPPFGLDGLWFYSALAALVVGELLIEPFFTKPADALANAIALVLACASVSIDGAAIGNTAARAGRLVLVISGLVLLAMACIAIAFKDRDDWIGKLADGTRRLVIVIGGARVVFSTLLFASGYAAFADDAGRIAALYLAWFAIAFVAPVESLLAWRRSRETPRATVGSGRVEQLEDPGIVVARFQRGTRLKIGDSVQVADGRAGVVVDITTLVDQPRARIALESPSPARPGTRVAIVGQGKSGARTVGFVGERTTLADLHMRTAGSSADLGLGEGRLLQATVSGQQVLYQITEAIVAGRLRLTPRETWWM